MQSDQNDRSNLMDPLVQLPKELVRLVVQLLRPTDLVALAGVSRAWRREALAPTLWDSGVRLRFPGDRPGLLRVAPAIAHLDLLVEDLTPRHMAALLAGRGTVHSLTCLPGATEKDGGDANPATLLRILQRVSQSLQCLSILCNVGLDTGIFSTSANIERALKIIVAMPRLRELTLGEMSFYEDSHLSPQRSVPVRREGLQKLCVREAVRGRSWAHTVVNLLRAHCRTLRSLELREIGPMNGAVVASIAMCRDLRSLTLEVPLASHRFNLMSAYRRHTKRLYRQLPKALTHLEHLKLLLPCPFDVDSSEDTDDGEGVGLDELAAGLRHYTSLQTMELVVLCGSAQRAEPRVEANEALLRVALPATTDVRARVQQVHCYCSQEDDEDEDDPDNMIDAFYGAAGDDATSYVASGDDDYEVDGDGGDE